MQRKGFIGLVAETGTRPHGYLTGFRIAVMPSLFYIDQLLVDAEQHGKGIGRRLLTKTASLSSNSGIARIFLLTKPDTIAEKFYPLAWH